MNMHFVLTRNVWLLKTTRSCPIPLRQLSPEDGNVRLSAFQLRNNINLSKGSYTPSLRIRTNSSKHSAKMIPLLLLPVPLRLLLHLQVKNSQSTRSPVVQDFRSMSLILPPQIPSTPWLLLSQLLMEPTIDHHLDATKILRLRPYELPLYIRTRSQSKTARYTPDPLLTNCSGFFLFFYTTRFSYHFPTLSFCSRWLLTDIHSSLVSSSFVMISSPGLRVPEPLTQLIPTTWRDVRQPFESLDLVPNLSTVRFELDVSLLLYQALNYITATLDTLQLETKEYTVDDLKDVIYSRLG